MFWVWSFWLISLLLSPLHVFLDVPYVVDVKICEIACTVSNVSCCWLTYWHVLLSVFFCLANLQISRYCIHIDANPFSAPPNHPALRSVPSPRQFAADALRRAVFSLSLQGIWGAFASPNFFCPQSLGQFNSFQREAYKKEILMKSVHGFITVLVVKTCAYRYIYIYILYMYIVYCICIYLFGYIWRILP